ncbi:hypothetical protein DTO164E3_5122 [Paecilomyces variotii]|nr:hypothetical protein DTO164E3_5122 [Paecilomyces variotii]KAJ9200838.1 hypothetical protein DTO032I3_4312 [Paecilomyces variotii]KAJ9231705.1 hypothetical protein DTO169E5_7864 [Paecilomyces variotii]KAJ9250722.1 hypothetical protein DTO207G8_5907 [Paecilomyces variotii]KAJ9278506.1 hypothetical protein DTO021D3_4704 [Paecilomyces variotii]
MNKANSLQVKNRYQFEIIQPTNSEELPLRNKAPLFCPLELKGSNLAIGLASGVAGEHGPLGQGLAPSSYL